MYVDYTKEAKINFSSKSELAYLNELEDCTPLKKQEIYDLISEIKKKKKSTLEKSKVKLVKSNLRFVTRVANYYHFKNNNLELSDLIQEGNIGLFEAVNDVVNGKYINKKKYSFISYAVWRIRGKILAYINKNKSDDVSYDNFSDVYEESNVGLRSYDLDTFRDNISVDDIKEHNDNAHDMKMVEMFLASMTRTEEYVIREYYGITKKGDTSFKYDKTFEEVGEGIDLSINLCSKVHKRALERVQRMLLINTSLFI